VSDQQPQPIGEPHEQSPHRPPAPSAREHNEQMAKRNGNGRQ
jgi:hypothetical protein